MIYHYTDSGAWSEISTSGEIRASHYNYVWFSSDPLWERSLNIPGTDQHKRISAALAAGKKLVRIGVDPSTAPITFRDSVPAATVELLTAIGLLGFVNSQLTLERDMRYWQSGKPYPVLGPNLLLWVGYGSENFRVREGACPRELWKAVEVWDGERWHALPAVSLR